MWDHICSMVKEVLIGVSEELFPAFSQHWFSEETAAALKSSFPVDIRVMDMIPMWPHEGQLKYLQSIGVPMPKLDSYRMRIGVEVQQITEHIGGVELPPSVLDTVDTFRQEVLSRLRSAIGLVESN